MKTDYTWRCDCGIEGTSALLSEAKADAKKHQKKPHRLTTKNVYIDQWLEDKQELSGKYWIIKG